MLRRVFLISVLSCVIHSFALEQAEFSGNCDAFKTAFTGLFTEFASHDDFTLPAAGTKIIVWSQLGGDFPQSAENIQTLLEFVQNGVCFSSVRVHLLRLFTERGISLI